MSKLSLKLKVYLALFFLGGTAFLVYALSLAKAPVWSIFLIFVFLNNAAESFPVMLPSGGLVSVGFAISFASMIVLGPGYAALSGFISAWNFSELLETRRQFHKVLFNAFNFALSTGFAGYVYIALGGRITMIEASQFPWIIVPIAFSAIVYYLFNTLTIALAINLEKRLPVLYIFRQNFLWQVPNYLMLSVVGIVLAQVYYITGPGGIVLIVVPLIIARQTFQVYMKLKEAYLETVRSLVRALEAKDAYTSGHSERVAQYAVKIARQMKFSEQMIEMVNYAALLHDVGKIGVSRKILNKPTRLSRSEYDRIQEHPKIGARIIEEIDFLREPLSAVLYHHEHIDGSGYSFGLKGEEIPVLARILTVADSFDAMTSARPYRDGMSVSEACQELMRCSGSQFDRDTVVAFLEAIEADRQLEAAREGEEVVMEKA